MTRKFTLELGPKVTRDGRKARVICIDRSGTRPVVALVDDGDEDVYYFLKDGSFAGSEGAHWLDLFDAPASKWINLFRGLGLSASVHDTRKLADEYAKAITDLDLERIACVEIEVKEGEGL